MMCVVLHMSFYIFDTCVIDVLIMYVYIYRSNCVYLQHISKYAYSIFHSEHI